MQYPSLPSLLSSSRRRLSWLLSIPFLSRPAATQPLPDAERRALERDLAAALAAPEPAVAPTPDPSPPVGSGSLRLIDISLDMLGVVGLSTAPEAELRLLEAGGHDPKNHGFTLQNVELTLAGVVDPFLRGDAHVVLAIDEEGETLVELEEAYLTTLDLPFHLELRAGHFFTSFGRLNPTHPHSWDFVDQPVVNSRFMGPDGQRAPGAQLSWLTPLPFFAELVLSAQNARGETLPSFLGVAGQSFAGRTLIEREVQGLGDLLYLVRARTSFDAADTLTFVLGASALFGPNGSGEQTSTRIYGADLLLRWRPLESDHGWPFVSWQSEGMYRDYAAAAVIEGDELVAPETSLADWGFYSQLSWGFSRPFVAGVRYDRARGEPHSVALAENSYASSVDPLRDERQRLSAVLTYYPSEFSKLRVQYAYDRSDFMSQGDAHGAFLQFEILFGAHGAHKF
jgi:hypothetical protein